MGCAGHNQLEPASCDYADGESAVSKADLTSVRSYPLPTCHEAGYLEGVNSKCDNYQAPMQDSARAKSDRLRHAVYQ